MLLSLHPLMDMKLHNRNVIPKLIWELFIRRPTQEMIKRVVGNEKASGIYKITYKKTGEAYIGKTTDFSEPLYFVIVAVVPLIV